MNTYRLRLNDCWSFLFLINSRNGSSPRPSFLCCHVRFSLSGRSGTSLRCHSPRGLGRHLASLGISWSVEERKDHESFLKRYTLVLSTSTRWSIPKVHAGPFTEYTLIHSCTTRWPVKKLVYFSVCARCNQCCCLHGTVCVESEEVATDSISWFCMMIVCVVHSTFGGMAG